MGGKVSLVSHCVDVSVCGPKSIRDGKHKSSIAEEFKEQIMLFHDCHGSLDGWLVIIDNIWLSTQK